MSSCKRSVIKPLYGNGGQGIFLLDKKDKNYNQIMIKMLEKIDNSEVAGSLLEEVGYIDMLQSDKTPESEGRLENLKKLVSDIKNRASLQEFLEEV